MAAGWQYLQGAAATGTGVSTLSVTFANNVQPGSKIIVFTTSTSLTATPDAPTDDSGANTWTAVGAANSGSPNGPVVQQMFFLDTPSGDFNTKPTINIVYNASANVAISVIEVAGLLAGNTTACLDGTQAVKTITGAASEAQPAYTSHFAGYFFAVGYGDNGGPAIWTVPAGYLADNSGGTGIVFAGVNDSSTTNNGIAYKSTTGGAEGTPNWTFGGTPTSMGSGFVAVAFKIAGVGSGESEGQNFPPGQQFAPLARQFGPVPPFAVARAQGPLPAVAPSVPGYGALRSPVTTGFPTDVGPNSASVGNGATLPRRGRITGISSGVYDQVGPPFRPDSSPVAQGSTSAASSSANEAQLPRRGRTYGVSHSGVFDQTGSSFYPSRQPAATRSRGLPPRGRTLSNPGVRLQAGAPFYPLRKPAAAVARPLPLRGRSRSNAGIYDQTGPVVTPQQRALQAKVVPLPPFGRTATMVPLVTTVTPVAAVAPFTPQGQIIAKSRGLPPRGRTRSGAGVFDQTGPAVTPLQRAVQAKAVPLPPFGRTATMVPLVTSVVAPSVAPFRPQGLVAARSRGLPVRGRVQSLAGTYQGTGPVVEPVHQPAGARVIGVRAGGTQSFIAAPQPTGPPFYPIRQPVTAKVRVLPPRGQSRGRAGTFTPGAIATFYPQPHPVQAKAVPLPPFGRTATMVPLTYVLATSVTIFYPLNRPVATPARGLPPRGVTRSNAGVREQTGPQFYPLNHPVRARQPLPPRGTAQGRSGTFTAVVPSQATFYPLGRPAAAVIRPLPVRGRTRGTAGVFYRTGPALIPQQRPAQAKQLRPPITRGRVASNPGTSGNVGPRITPWQGPVRAAFRVQPPRGRTQGHPGTFGQTGPPVKPLQRPVFAFRLGPQRGRTVTSIRPAPPIPFVQATFYPLRHPVQSRRPLPPRGRSLTTPPYVLPAVPTAEFVLVGGASYTQWHAGDPSGQWDASAVASEWEAGIPDTAWRTGATATAWQDGPTSQT